jgi:hypothetical protein
MSTPTPPALFFTKSELKQVEAAAAKGDRTFSQYARHVCDQWLKKYPNDVPLLEGENLGRPLPKRVRIAPGRLKKYEAAARRSKLIVGAWMRNVVLTSLKSDYLDALVP